MGKYYTHLNNAERSLIQVSLELGQSQADIARSLTVHEVVSVASLHAMAGRILPYSDAHEVAQRLLEVTVQ